MANSLERQALALEQSVPNYQLLAVAARKPHAHPRLFEHHHARRT
jgi:exonuclease VII small subunit